PVVPAAAPADAPAAVVVPTVEVPAAPIVSASSSAPIGQLDLAAFQREWPEVLKDLAKISRPTWMMAQTIKIVSFENGILTLEFANAAESDTFKKAAGAPGNLRQAIQNVLGVNPQFKAQVAAATLPPKVTSSLPSLPEPGPAIPDLPEVATNPVPKAASKASKPVAAAPEAQEVPLEPAAAPAAEPEQAEAPEESAGMGKVHTGASYGEPLLREILGAKPVDDFKGGR
ncbi:MAG: hypothetical protein RIQ44_232, partial [Actinomycetota bacterium]